MTRGGMLIWLYDFLKFDNKYKTLSSKFLLVQRNIRIHFASRLYSYVERVEGI